jgi:hypothetical protein
MGQTGFANLYSPHRRAPRACDQRVHRRSEGGLLADLQRRVDRDEGEAREVDQQDLGGALRVGLALFTLICCQNTPRMKASMVHVTTRVAPGSDTPLVGRMVRSTS